MGRKGNETPADETFCRLCADLSLARRVEQGMKRGQIEQTDEDTVHELARRGLDHLAAYVAAIGFASDLNSNDEDDLRPAD